MALPQYSTEHPDVTVANGAQAIINHLVSLPSLTQRRAYVRAIEAEQRILSNEVEAKAQATFDEMAARVGEKADPSLYDILIDMMRTMEGSAEHLTGFLATADVLIARAVEANAGRGLTAEFMTQALRAPLLSHERQRAMIVRQYPQVVAWTRQAGMHPRGLIWTRPGQTAGQLADELIARLPQPSIAALEWATAQLQARTKR